MVDRRTSRSDGAADGGWGGAEDGAGPMFRRVILTTGLASVPTALADLDLVRGAARSLALALALAIIVVGVGFLHRPLPVFLRDRSGFRVPRAEKAPPASATLEPATIAAANSPPPAPSAAPSPEPPNPLSGPGEGP